MRVNVRFLLFASTLACALALAAPAAYASFGIEKFVAVNCNVETCAETTRRSGRSPTPNPRNRPRRRSRKKKASRRPEAGCPFGITDFKVKTEGSLSANEKPEGGPVTHIRTDVAPGPRDQPDRRARSAPKKRSGQKKWSKAQVPFACADVPGTGSVIGKQQSHGLRGSPRSKTFRWKARSTTSCPTKATPPNSGSPLEPRAAGQARRVRAHVHQRQRRMGQGHGSRPQTPRTRGRSRATTTTTSKSRSRRRCPWSASRLVFFGNENQETKKPDDFITNGTSCPGQLHHHAEARKAKKASRPNRSPTPRPIAPRQLRRSCPSNRASR